MLHMLRSACNLHCTLEAHTYMYVYVCMYKYWFAWGFFGQVVRSGMSWGNSI